MKEKKNIIKKKDDFVFYQIGNIQCSLDNIKQLLNNEWISDSIIEAYLNAIADSNQTLVLNYFHATSIFENGELFYNDTYAVIILLIIRYIYIYMLYANLCFEQT